MSPILVRPVREQLEHDRIIRLLQSRTKRRHESIINPGAEQNGGVGTGPKALFPDLVVYTLERGRKLQAVVEVETSESVNHLEALAQWAHLSKLKVPFHLYVPAPAIDVARRLASEYQINIAELWMYDSIGDQVRFTLVQRSAQAARGADGPRTSSRAAASRPTPAGRRKPAAPARPPVKNAKRATPAGPRKAAVRKAVAKSGSRKKGTAQKRR